MVDSVDGDRLAAETLSMQRGDPQAGAVGAVVKNSPDGRGHVPGPRRVLRPRDVSPHITGPLGIGCFAGGRDGIAGPSGDQ